MKILEGSIYYAAYGMNTEILSMIQRCPTAQVVGKGYIEDYELTCRLYFNIEEKQGSKVEVAVWRLKESDIKILDRVESYPDFYDRKQVVVHMKEGAIVPALVYFMKQKPTLSKPRVSYISLCRRGYERFGLSLSQLDEAIARSINEDKETKG